ncbi:Hypothetical protein NTJ_12502 [Nesidiocoris tenuis]|uniref:PDZ domain-containing protein n=1 Tax=Nesidiocoris tenuis TaxID=355587 RepID=A0ABN7B5K2_9HEMI|nr:Hypothetical protein NTJ_12502 [Nesidiocoris tenuis]
MRGSGCCGDPSNLLFVLFHQELNGGEQGQDGGGRVSGQQQQPTSQQTTETERKTRPLTTTLDLLTQRASGSFFNAIEIIPPEGSFAAVGRGGKRETPSECL